MLCHEIIMQYLIKKIHYLPVSLLFYGRFSKVPEYKPAISDNMRARLLKEASTGLDADKPQTNVILYISIVVAILVALGGQGILF